MGAHFPENGLCFPWHAQEDLSLKGNASTPKREERMNEFTPHELELMEKMTPQHKDLMPKLNAKERKSLAKYVTSKDLELIQSWIGTDEEIERMLFWDRGDRFDDPEWQTLEPVDKATASLHEKATAHFEQLKAEAVESQRRSDLTLYSQFNTGLLFTGLAGALRCDKNGNPEEKGSYFKGLEWRCIGSVEENINSITIFPVDSGNYEVHLGSRLHQEAQGIWVNAGDSHSLLQLAQLSEKVLPKNGFETMVKDPNGKPLDLDPRALRRAVMGDGERVYYGEELKLHASARVEDANRALQGSDTLAYRFYERFGLETECHKIGKKYGNFSILRDDNFDRFLPVTPVDGKGLVLLTATLVCRRCRREMEEFRDLAKLYPQVKSAVVNLNSPQFKFYERVFGDMSGGNVDEFRKTAAGVTPFIIIYAPDENGVLQFAEYIATGKAENTPSIRNNMHILDRYFK
jgi:hypothetical protein